ncbi:MAG: SDR family NAD(P)-dependent oxidoreductase [Planctomycetota bacterium]
MTRASSTTDLGGLRAVVTGGGSGIGRGIAHVLARRGAAIALLGRTAGKLDAVVAELRQQGATACAVVADVTDRAGTARAVDAAREQLGGLDALVNNAGVGGPNACAAPGPDRWDEIVRTNVDGVYHATCAAVPHLPDGGRVVSISSVLGRFGVPGYTGYCASKHAVIGFTKALALELAPRRITVNAICPGWVDTDMATEGLQLMADGMGTTLEQARATAMSAVPLGRILQPEEIGELVAWLCSKAAAGMTGQAISHCGGQVMW